MGDFLMVLSTVAIAFFSGLTWNISKRIHESTEKRDSEVNDILLKLAASNLTAGVEKFDVKLLIESFDKVYNDLKTKKN